MGLESFVRVLYTPEDALSLRQGTLRSSKLKNYRLQEFDVLEAAEILIALDDARYFHSQADVITRAMSYDWLPQLVDETESFADKELALRVKGTPIVNPLIRSFRRRVVYSCISKIKQFLLKTLRINVYTLHCGGISKDILVKLHLIHRAKHRIRQVAVSPSGGWVILYGRNGFLYANVSIDVSAKLWEFSNAGEVLKQLAFAPDNRWVMLRDNYGFWQYSVPRMLSDKLWSCHNLRQEIRDVAIAPDWGWIVLYGKDGSAHNGLPDALTDKLWELKVAGERIKQIAFAPNGGWVIVREYNDFWYHDIPDDLVEMLWRYHRSGKEIKRICFAPDSGWIILGG